MNLYISKNIKAIIFDLDGTLINSSKTVLEILNEIRQKYLKKKKIKINKITNLLSIGGKILIKKSLQLKKKSDIDYYLKFFRHIYLRKKFKKKDIFPNVINFLKKLKKNKIKVIICTNKNSELVRKIVNNNYFKKYINFFVTSDMVNSYKPDKIFLDYIIKKTKIKKNDFHYIGDSKVDIELCKHYNMKFFIYKNVITDINKSTLSLLNKKKYVFNNYNKITFNL
jgi:phosphoglycolate phosphatase